MVFELENQLEAKEINEKLEQYYGRTYCRKIDICIGNHYPSAFVMKETITRKNIVMILRWVEKGKGWIE